MTHSDIYREVFYSPEVHKVLVSGSIIKPESDASALVRSLLARLETVERCLGEDARDTSLALSDLEDLIGSGVCILGTPLLTNVAFSHPTLSSCSAVPLPIGPFSWEHADAAASYYRLNMGSGYNLDSAADPITLLYDLNAHAQQLTQNKICERYIGNMAHISVHHSKIRQFISSKVDRLEVVHFNISVDVSKEFMVAVEADGCYTLWDGSSLKARDVWDELVSCAWQSGDPGLVCLERFNRGNSIRDTSPYVTTAPCAEVGLSEGETCVFGYINLAACLTSGQSGLDLDEQLVARAARCLTRVLDDAVEDSLAGSPKPVTALTMAQSRKIGIGVCGYADALLLLGLDYGSEASCILLNRALSTINFSSKCASTELSARRGSFGAYDSSRYRSEVGFLTRAASRAKTPGPEAWQELDRDVSRWGLRNAMTTALPPSGRSSLLLGVNSSIEPFLTFSLTEQTPLLLRDLIRNGLIVISSEGCVQNLPSGLATHDTSSCSPFSCGFARSLFRRATDIPPSAHLAVLAEATALVDDGVSKTVNLREAASISDVADIYLGAWRAGLKAISIYRNPSTPSRAA